MAKRDVNRIIKLGGGGKKGERFATTAERGLNRTKTLTNGVKEGERFAITAERGLNRTKTLTNGVKEGERFAITAKRGINRKKTLDNKFKKKTISKVDPLVEVPTAKPPAGGSSSTVIDDAIETAAKVESKTGKGNGKSIWENIAKSGNMGYVPATITGAGIGALAEGTINAANGGSFSDGVFSGALHGAMWGAGYRAFKVGALGKGAVNSKGTAASFGKTMEAYQSQSLKTILNVNGLVNQAKNLFGQKGV